MKTTYITIFILTMLLLLSGCNSNCDIPTSFRWTSGGPLISPKPDAAHDVVSIKDPTLVHFDGRWHVYATVANTSGKWSLVYLNFTDWEQADSAPQYYLDTKPSPDLSGYKAAPQVFYFRPQKKWYLIYQAGPPQYSTADDLSEWQTWTRPKNFFTGTPAIVQENKGDGGGWLDFFVICDDVNCYLFFTDDNGHLYRAQTSLEDFPNGFHKTTIVLSDTKENLYEGSAHYKIKGKDKYLTVIEAFGPNGHRYYKAWVANHLAGDWTPLATTWENPFAAPTNVTFLSGAVRRDISHGEIIRDGYDETMTIDICKLQILYQSMDPSTPEGLPYSQLPYSLGLLAAQK